MAIELEGAGFSEAQHIELEEEQGSVFLYAGLAMAIFTAMILLLAIKFFTGKSS